MEKLNTNFFKKDDKSKLIIYHGSNELKGLPVFGKGKKINDYGLGFYCAEDLEKAKLWSVMNNTNGFVNKYELDLKDLKILRLDDKNICQWLAILAKYRIVDDEGLKSILDRFIKKFLTVDVNDYDCIIGYRADDSYFSIVRRFFSGTIALEDLSNLLHLGNLGYQFVLKSKKAFERLKFSECYNVDKSEYYSKYVKSDLRARRSADYIFKSSVLFQGKGTTVFNVLKEEKPNG